MTLFPSDLVFFYSDENKTHLHFCPLPHTHVYHQGHLTPQDTTDHQCLDSLVRNDLLDQQFMSNNPGVVRDSDSMMGIIRGPQENDR